MTAITKSRSAFPSYPAGIAPELQVYLEAVRQEIIALQVHGLSSISISSNGGALQPSTVLNFSTDFSLTQTLLGPAVYQTNIAVAAAQPNITSIGTLTVLTIRSTTEGVIDAQRSTAGTAGFELGSANATGGTTYIDLHINNASDFDFRLLRNSGTNGSVDFVNAGSGNMRFFTDNTNRWLVTGSGNAAGGGHLIPQLDNTYDIGYSAGPFRPRAVKVAGNVTIEANTDGTAFIVTTTSDTAALTAASNYRRARATGGLVQTGDVIGGIYAAGAVDATPTFSANVAVVNMRAAENFDATHSGAYIVFATTSLGATTRSDRWRIEPAGHLFAQTDGVVDIGASGANRPRDLFLNRDAIVSGAVKLTTAVSKVIPGATSLSLRNNADSANNLLLSDAGVATLRNDLVVSTLGTFDSTNASLGAPTKDKPLSYNATK